MRTAKRIYLRRIGFERWIDHSPIMVYWFGEDVHVPLLPPSVECFRREGKWSPALKIGQIEDCAGGQVSDTIKVKTARDFFPWLDGIGKAKFYRQLAETDLAGRYRWIIKFVSLTRMPFALVKTSGKNARGDDGSEDRMIKIRILEFVDRQFESFIIGI